MKTNTTFNENVKYLSGINVKEFHKNKINKPELLSPEKSKMDKTSLEELIVLNSVA